MLANGITPLVTLFYWDLPVAVHNCGGRVNRKSIQFAEYADVIGRSLGDRVKH